ncbi:hypothetical protein D3C84_1305650 [compost metagenome]
MEDAELAYGRTRLAAGPFSVSGLWLPDDGTALYHHLQYRFYNGAVGRARPFPVAGTA